MILAKVLDVLKTFQNIGHPVHFVTPDGKRWEIVKLQSVRTIKDNGSDSINSLIYLQESKEPLEK